MGIIIEEREPDIEGLGKKGKQGMLERLKDLLKRNEGTPTGGSTCRWEEDGGPTVDRFSRVGTVRPEHVVLGGPHWTHDRSQENKNMGQKQRRSPGNEQRFGRVGQPLGPLRIKAPLTLGGGGFPPE